jgi:hypothetical protein
MPVGKDDCRLPVHTLLTWVPQSEARSEVCHVCYVRPPDGRPLGTWKILGSHCAELESCQVGRFYVKVWACSHLTSGHCEDYIHVYVGLLKLKLFTLKPIKAEGPHWLETKWLPSHLSHHRKATQSFLSTEMDGYVVIDFQSLESFLQSINHLDVTICFIGWTGITVNFQTRPLIQSNMPKASKSCLFPWN